LKLTQSSFTGESITVALDRLYLKNALQTGCLRIGIDPTGDKPVICNGDSKTFICMPLKRTEPEYEASRINVIASPIQSTAATKARPVPAKCRVAQSNSVKPDSRAGKGKSS